MSENNDYLYTKDMDEPLIYIECVQLLEKLVENGYIQKDPNNADNILVYRQAGVENPEGWYTENLMSSASDLMRDEKGQKFLRETLAKDGIEMQFKDVMGAARDFLKPFEEIQKEAKKAKRDDMERQVLIMSAIAMKKMDYCDCLELVCKCAAEGIVQKDEKFILSSADELMKNPEEQLFISQYYKNYKKGK